MKQKDPCLPNLAHHRRFVLLGIYCPFLRRPEPATPGFCCENSGKSPPKARMLDALVSGGGLTQENAQLLEALENSTHTGRGPQQREKSQTTEFFIMLYLFNFKSMHPRI